MIASLTGIEYKKSVKWNNAQLTRISLLANNGGGLSTPQQVLLNTILDIQMTRARAMNYQISLLNKRQTLQNIPQINNKQGINYVLLKPVSDGCNLHCSYCYEGPAGVRNELDRMSITTLERVITQVCSQGIPKVGFSFHGGEPLMAGIDFFKRAMEIQAPFREAGVAIENTVQTNGTLLNEKWINFFKENNFSVGTSFDGVKDIHNKHRVYSNGKGSYDHVAKRIKLMQQQNVTFGIISVITNEHEGYAREHFETFCSLNITDFAVTPAFGLIGDIDVGTTDAKVFSDYVIDLFETWLYSGQDGIKIRVIHDALSGLLGDTLTICSLAGTCTKIIAVEPDGSVKSCTRSCGEAEKVFGNILQNDLADIVTGPLYSDFKRNEFGGQQEASQCDWFEICHNGCSANRVKNGKVDVSGRGRFCNCDAAPGKEVGYAGIYRHIKNRAEELLELNLS